MMEILREVRVSTANADCFSTGESSFHVNLNGSVFNMMNNSGYVTVKDVHIPTVSKTISLELGYAKREMIKDTPLMKLDLTYTSFEHLCKLISLAANNMILDETCTIEGDHMVHVCDNYEKHMFSLTYEDDVFCLRQAQGYVTTFSKNLCDMMGFKWTSENENDNFVRFVGRMHLVAGNANNVSFLTPEQKMAHFIFPDYNLKNFYKGNFYSTLFSYDMMTGKSESQPNFKLVKQNEHLRFRIYNDDMAPYKFTFDLRKYPISFTLVFCDVVKKLY